MSNGGFLDGFEGGSEPAKESAPVAQPESTPTPEVAPIYESVVTPEPDNEISAEMTPGEVDERVAKQMQQERFLEAESGLEMMSGDAEDESTEADNDAQGTARPVSNLQEQESEKDEVYLEVEKILEDGLGSFVETMEPTAKERFLKKGREVTGLIAAMVRSLHVKTKDVFHLLKEWLLTIPGVNKFFLEQEVKIKTDRIIDLEQVRREDHQPKL